MKKKHVYIIGVFTILIGIIILYYIIPIKKVYNKPIENIQVTYKHMMIERLDIPLSSESKINFINVFNTSKLKHTIKKTPRTIQYKPYDFQININQQFFSENQYLSSGILSITMDFFHDFNPNILNTFEQEKELENYPKAFPENNWTVFITITTRFGTTEYQFADDSTIDQLVDIIKNEFY